MAAASFADGESELSAARVSRIAVAGFADRESDGAAASVLRIAVAEAVGAATGAEVGDMAGVLTSE